MKILAVIAVLCSSFAIAACGGGDSTEATESSAGGGQGSTVAQQEGTPGESAGAGASKPAAGVSGPPKVTVPSGPPPTDLVVKDLKVGKGPAAGPDSRLAVHFVAADYKSGKVFETRWGLQPFLIEYDHGLPMQGWEEGLAGMRVGGRRKILVPSRLAYKEGSIVYIVDLLSVEKLPH